MSIETNSLNPLWEGKVKYNDLLNTKLSYFRNCRSKTPEEMTLEGALYFIKRGSSEAIIERIRNTNNKALRENEKRKLPAVSFGGIFKNRTDLIAASGLACLDFDKVEGLNHLKASLKDSKYILSYWLSPSGNGLKALVKIPIVKDKTEYKDYYKALLYHFKDLQPDEATKDINRLCFESFDPGLYLDEDSEVFREKIKSKRRKESIRINVSPVSEGKIIDRLLSWWIKNYPFTEGSRNNNLFILACKLCEFGIDKGTTENLFNSFEDADFDHAEIEKLTNSAYKTVDFNSKNFSL